MRNYLRPKALAKLIYQVIILRYHVNRITRRNFIKKTAEKDFFGSKLIKKVEYRALASGQTKGKSRRGFPIIYQVLSGGVEVLKGFRAINSHLTTCKRFQPFKIN